MQPVNAGVGVETVAPSPREEAEPRGCQAPEDERGGFGGRLGRLVGDTG
jgi:hypothetical protein